jgi:hypothetical protein
MVIVGTEEDGEQFLLLGLSENNLEQLRRGQPIRIRRETHGAAIPRGLVIAIMWGETEREIAIDLVGQGLLKPDAVRRQFPDPEAE